MANPLVPQTRVDQTSTAVVATQITLTIPAPPVGQTNYLEGFTVTGAPGTVAGTAAITVTGIEGQTWTFEVINPIAGGLLFELFFPTPRQASGAIVVTVPAMAATSGAVAATAFAYQQ